MPHAAACRSTGMPAEPPTRCWLLPTPGQCVSASADTRERRATHRQRYRSVKLRARSCGSTLTSEARPRIPEARAAQRHVPARACRLFQRATSNLVLSFALVGNAPVQDPAVRAQLVAISSDYLCRSVSLRCDLVTAGPLVAADTSAANPPAARRAVVAPTAVP